MIGSKVKLCGHECRGSGTGTGITGYTDRGKLAFGRITLPWPDTHHALVPHAQGVMTHAVPSAAT